jgi:alkanesulfonate monooxygenase SsuD/methylene tetrahydromethanopterin reductase-like flavin-dependent oxidoreductase (luciferase family)
MRVGLALSVLDLDTWTQRRLADVVEEAQWAEANGFDSVWISDHFFMTQGDERAAGLEPLTTIAHLAARTSRVTLGTLVLCNNFRHPGQLARELASLVEATEGRLTVGLGCGAQPNEHEAFVLPYAQRVTRLEETLTVLPPLLRGEHVTYDGRLVKLTDASISTTGQAPPFWVAAFKPRMIEITARLAQGWGGNWNGPDPSEFRAQVAVVRDALAAAGRADEPFELAANLLVVPTREDPGEVAARVGALLPGRAVGDRDVTFGDAARIVEVLRGYEDAGATHAIVAPGPRQFSAFSGSDRDELAAAIAELTQPAQVEVAR